MCSTIFTGGCARPYSNEHRLSISGTKKEPPKMAVLNMVAETGFEPATSGL